MQEHDAVLRFNKLNQIDCGEKTTIWMVRYSYEAPDKYHGLGKSSLIASQIPQLLPECNRLRMHLNNL